MAILTSCCLNLSPPPPGSSHPSSLPSRTNEVAWRRKNGTWKGRCVVGITCMIIGLEMSNLISDESRAVAEDLKLEVAESKEKVGRWSDKRMCPPWQMNSLETIVPENLPRPSAHRRWEAVGYSKTAPPLKVLRVRTSTNCFSM